ncbi:MAG: peptidoglycan-binding protein [Gammaproteobacteria bacterium]
MAVRFSQMRPNDGFDGSASPNWQMVPVGGSKRVGLHGAAGLAVASSDTSIATVASATAHGHTTLTITGVAKGNCQIQIGAGPAFAAVLDVAVKSRKTVSTAFHYVDDGHRQKTRRRISDLNAMITAANNILLPQANVEISRRSAAALPIAQNLGRVVRFSSHLPGVPAAQHEWDVVTSHADATADFNVFFVVEYEQDATPLHDDTEAGTLGGSCIFEDNTGEPAGVTLAHELGHHLGLGHSRNRHHLMADSSGSGTQIPKADADIINP